MRISLQGPRRVQTMIISKEELALRRRLLFKLWMKTSNPQRGKVYELKPEFRVRSMDLSTDEFHFKT